MLDAVSFKPRALKVQAHALIVDDNDDIRYTISSILAFDGIASITADSYGAALQQVAVHQPLLCICDIFMPHVGGLQLIATLRYQGYGGRILAVSAGGDQRAFGVLQAATILGADATLRKPFEVNQLRRVVDDLLGASNARALA